ERVEKITWAGLGIVIRCCHVEILCVFGCILLNASDATVENWSRQAEAALAFSKHCTAKGSQWPVGNLVG
ncbi:unnamed protein product, partial [Musa textilis]